MVRLVQGGPSMFNARAYAENHPTTIEFFTRQFEGLGSRLTEAGRGIALAAQQVFEQFNSSEALQRARALARGAMSLFETDTIRPLWDLADLQNASPFNQRWMMANPTWRREYHAQRCDGFAGSYIDIFPNSIGEQHLDYRMVMNGVVQFVARKDEEGNEVMDESDWMYTVYYDELLEGDRPLDLAEQVAIQQTWAAMDRVYDEGEYDATSPVGARR